jgi:UDP-N-acetyl-2-amino-2-deoxyglucuronate dehydrogenase
MKYKVGIIGCGAILPRHIEAIQSNPDFELVALCDIQPELVKSLGKRYKVKTYIDYQKMITNEDINFIPILTPNSLHKEQALFALKNNCDVLVEKPVGFHPKDINEIKKCAKNNKQKAYCVLQVRLNPTVDLAKKILTKNMLGELRGFSFTQRWQRPLEYFSGWRGEPEIGGGILYETGIHYLDILQYLLGVPTIKSSTSYITKHKGGVIEDTIYALADYKKFGGTIESTIASEPKNIESSICLMGSNGYLKIGGKALNIIESATFLSNAATKQYEVMVKDFKINQPNSYGSYQGSCPNHPDVYLNLNKFDINESYNVVKIIHDIYSSAGIDYSS